MFGKVIEIAPEWYGTYVNVGSIYGDMGQYEKAIDPLKKSIAIRPSLCRIRQPGHCAILA